MMYVVFVKFKGRSNDNKLVKYGNILFNNVLIEILQFTK